MKTEEKKQKIYYTNMKISEIPSWNLNLLRRTKEYQEKRKQFIEDNGGKCGECKSIKYLSVSHPQNYINIFFKNDFFYASVSNIILKQVCPGCEHNEVIDEQIKFKSKLKTKNYFFKKKRRTDIRFKYKCAYCEKRFKKPKLIKKIQVGIVKKLPYFFTGNTKVVWRDTEIPRVYPEDRFPKEVFPEIINRTEAENEGDIENIIKDIKNRLNKESWIKYISFVDAKLLCRSCHFRSHLLPLKIIDLKIQQNRKV